MILVRLFFQLFWIGFCAVAMLAQTRLLLGGAPPSGWLTGFVFGATVFGYNYAAPRYRRWPAWGMGAAGAACFLKLTLVQQIVALVPLLIWLLYYGLHRPGRAGLRKFPALKPVAIAVAWAWVTVFIPLPPDQWTGAAALFVGRAAFIFALALAYDLCDLAYDRRQGFVTLVLQIGPRASFRLIDAALLLSAVCVGVNVALQVYALPFALALLFSLALSAAAIHWITPRLPWGDWRKAGIDGLMIVQLVLVWISGE